MNFISNLKNNQKFFIVILIFLLVLLTIYLYLEETNNEDVINVKEEIKVESTKNFKNEEMENKIDLQTVVEEDLNKKEIKPKQKKNVEAIKEKEPKLDIIENVYDKKNAIQIISELHKGLIEISGKDSSILEATKKLVSETYFTEKMLKMIIGDSWQNVNNQTKQKMINVFEEYIAKNYIKRFSRIKNPLFSDLKEKKVGDYKLIKSDLILSKDEKVSINYLLSFKNQKWKIFDVLLAGSVSEIATKKSEFKGFIKDGDINPLIEALSQKNKILIN